MIAQSNAENLNTKINKNNKPKIMKPKINKIFKEYNYLDYLKNNSELLKCKIADLKTIAKQNNLYVSGTKPVLIERITDFFKKTSYSIKIQKIFRAFLVKRFLYLKGPALNKGKICSKNCVNESDFYTLEPIDQIEIEFFYSFSDEKNFTYGFDILSLMQLFVKNNLIRNPYNREILHFKIWKDIFSLYHISCILFPQFDTSYSLSYEEKHNIKIAYQNICRRLYIQKKKNNSNKIQPQNIVIESPEISESNDSELNPTINSIFQNETDELSMTEQITTVSRNQIVNRLNSIQIKPIDNRIQELFMEIDQLGNYSQSSWFSNLSLNECVRFIRYLHQYWTIRGRIPNSTKQKICVLYDPFAQYNINLILSAGSIDDFKNYCVVIMELLIYCGENIEYRKLGALYVLSALTVVSIHARRAMPWLYEAL